jgi:biotin synthase-like enzyme
MAIDHPELEECVEDFDSVFCDVDGFEEAENIKRLYENEDEEGLMEAAERLKKVIDDAEMHLSNIIHFLKK